jgi:chorismate mutase
MSATLDDLRAEIDRIDAELHELLIRRTEVSRQIGKVKDRNRPRLRPAREAAVLRRLIARHRGTLPKPVLVRIWREIIADSAAQQSPFAVAVYVGEQDRELGDLAREHFGVLTPLVEHGSPVRVLDAVASGKTALGVLPPMQAGGTDPWWRHLARDSGDVPRVVASLPFAAWPRDRGGESAALVVGLGPVEPSGEDRSFLVAELTERVSRAAFKDLLTRAGLDVRETQTWTDGDDAPYCYCLAEVEGFVDSVDSEPLASLRAAAGDKLAALWPIGSYPVPLSAAAMAPEKAGTARGRARK